MINMYGLGESHAHGQNVQLRGAGLGEVGLLHAHALEIAEKALGRKKRKEVGVDGGEQIVRNIPGASVRFANSLRPRGVGVTATK
jgi:hypothetical protein